MKLVILCGGSGTRLWPLSKTNSPKQFVTLFNNKSLFQLTIERNNELVDGIIIIVNEVQLDICKSQVPKELNDKVEFIIEPIGRNTAPAISLAALKYPNEKLLIVPSDHLVKKQDSYNQNILEAQKLADQNNLITFGITPTYPETGYGYIEAQGNDVLSFKEKPSLETAKNYLAKGNFYWNSGMFLFKSNVFLDELEKYQNEILVQSKNALATVSANENIQRIKKEDMLKIPSDSIDYAVMEKSKLVKVVATQFDWSDLGSYDALYEELPKDKDGNTEYAHSIHLNSKNNFIYGNKKFISTFDIEDLIIVETEDSILVGKKGDSQKIKTLLSQIKEKRQDLC